MEDLRQIPIYESYDEPNEYTKYVARSIIPFGSLQFALQYYPSITFNKTKPYAPTLAYEFMHSTDAQQNRDFIHLALWWRYKNVPGIPFLHSPTFFVIQHFALMLSSLGKTGEHIRDCNKPYALVSFICIDAPHTINPVVYDKCKSYFRNVNVDDIPKHVLMYALCLNQGIPWELRNEIMMTTSLTENPEEISYGPKSEFENKTQPEISSQFLYATASRVLGAFQYLERSSTPSPSNASLDCNYTPIQRYHTSS
jgi:hypothetical protein